MRTVITANGSGSRMKGLSPLPKHHLYYKDKRIIDHLLDIFPGAEVLEGKPSNSRRETLEYIRDYTNVLIVDCDVIPDKKILPNPSGREDMIWYFNSDKDKYSSLIINDETVIEASESKKISENRCSGLYFVKSITDLLSRMNGDSIAEAMIGAWAIQESSFIKLGDPEDYYEALGIHPGSFTGNRVEMNKNTVLKYCNTANSEAQWYAKATEFNVPTVRYFDNEMILTDRIYPTAKPTAVDFIKIITKMYELPGNGASFGTYLNNLPPYHKPIILRPHAPTFFHGDLSTTNVLKNSRLWLIDPNHKDVFGSWLTDAGKAYFSFVAYEQDYPSANKIADHFGPDVVNFAVAEGLRVCKYKPEYMSIVNNIAELCQP